MHARLMLGVGLAAGCAVAAGVLGAKRSARLEAFVRRSSGVLQGAGGLLSAAAAGTRDSDGAPSGGVIPLETVPIDELSEWELDLLTTPDS